MGEPISYEIVTEVWQRMSQTPLQQVDRLIRQMHREQPYFADYLLTQGMGIFNHHEREVVFYIGIVVWQIMKQGEIRPGRVTRKQLLDAENANYAFLEQLSEDTEGDFVSATLAMLENHTEREVFRYIIEALMEEDGTDQENPSIRDENRGLAFLVLKTALDSLAASRKPPRKPKSQKLNT